MNPATETSFADSPAPVLEQVFRRIERERMQGIPILNPNLRVEAVGFREWEHKWIGVLVTPWFMNLMVLPAPGGEWPALGQGRNHSWALPLGTYEFIVGFEDGIGEYHICSLLSPVPEFAGQEAARIAAQAALDTVMSPPRAEEPPPGPVRRMAENLDRPMSKRDFLAGGLLRR